MLYFFNDIRLCLCLEPNRYNFSARTAVSGLIWVFFFKYTNSSTLLNFPSWHIHFAHCFFLSGNIDVTHFCVITQDPNVKRRNNQMC